MPLNKKLELLSGLYPSVRFSLLLIHYVILTLHSRNKSLSFGLLKIKDFFLNVYIVYIHEVYTSITGI
jgi:hypothetical protein